jgi:hypothetical protein
MVATFCDRTEHNEESVCSDLISAAHRLRRLSIFVAEWEGIDLQERYADRLAHVEGSSMYEVALPSPSSEVRSSRTWRDLQVAQMRHDRHFHPDVFGLSRHSQLIHTSLHLAKINGAMAQLFGGSIGMVDDFNRRRLPDMLLFGIKISTIAGERLEDVPLNELSISAAAIGR